MKNFPIDKSIESKPIIMGLTPTNFWVFTGVGVILLGLFASSPSLFTFFALVLGVPITYIVCNLLANARLISKLYDDKFPDQIINDL